MAQWKWIWLVSMRTQVRSLALLRGLSIQCCRELWCELQTWLRCGIAVAVVQASGYSSTLPPCLGTSICRRCGPKKGQKKKKYHHYWDTPWVTWWDALLKFLAEKKTWAWLEENIKQVIHTEEPATSWFLVRFVSAAPRWELPKQRQSTQHPKLFQNVKVRLKETKEAYNQLQYCMIMGWILDGTEVALMAVNGPIADI